jgi:hypothetical protein
MGCGLNFDLSTSHPPIQTYPHLSTGKTQVIHILVHKLSTLLQLGRLEARKDGRINPRLDRSNLGSSFHVFNQ